MTGVSILVPTLDEEANIEACLAGVAWSDDIVVLDSHSGDRTVEIAGTLGARVVTRRFDDWSSHQNWALETIGFRHPWVFHLDADERMGPDMAAEVRDAAASSPAEVAAYYCGRRNHFMGRLIRHAMPPVPLLRLFRPARVRFRRLVHPVPVVDGRCGHLTGLLDHHNTSKGLAEWVRRHNRYSDLEAAEALLAASDDRWAGASLASGDPVERRRALKALSVRVPCRPLVKFLYMYLGQRGFLDGGAGFAYCVLQAFYEYMIVLKEAELRLAGGRPAADTVRAAAPPPHRRPGQGA
ncbi:MAG TPA: glycosyltransferase family 2 protein [Arenibaculum sp.]|nr:glycosyltransferase family 2 protein [Arenibaculum sp.]